MENRMDSKLDVLNYKQMDGLRVFLNTPDYRTPHFHKELEILLILDGDLEFLSERFHLSAGRGDMVLCNSGEAHELRKRTKSCTMLYYHAVCEHRPVPRRLQTAGHRAGQTAGHLLQCRFFRLQILFRHLFAAHRHDPRSLPPADPGVPKRPAGRTPVQQDLFHPPLGGALLHPPKKASGASASTSRKGPAFSPLGSDLPGQRANLSNDLHNFIKEKIRAIPIMGRASRKQLSCAILP